MGRVTNKDVGKKVMNAGRLNVNSAARGKYEDNLDHLLFQSPFLAHARNLVIGWLEIAGIDQDNFNRHTLIEMTEVDTFQLNVISNYKDIVLKNRKLAQRHDVKNQ